MTERIIKFGKNSHLSGIITYPSCTTSQKDFCVLLLNAGLIHKIGVNRVNVKIARKLANIEIACFRFDFSGIGDSEISNSLESSDQTKITEIKQAMDAVYTETKISKFYLKGICSGAEIAFKADAFRIFKVQFCSNQTRQIRIKR